MRAVTDRVADEDLDRAEPGIDEGSVPADALATNDRSDVGPVESDDGAEVDADVATRTSRRGRNRVGKWDRPPDPHDWRFFVGTLGKILIATGLLLFGFVAYQLWGTGIETARAQNKLENEFEELVAANQDVDDTAVVDAEPDETTGDDTSDDTGDDSGTSVVTTVPLDPATVTEIVTVVPEIVEQDLPPIERGNVLAKLEIPRIDSTTFVVPGVQVDDLKKGPGHYPDTPLPGQLGNASIAGHRTSKRCVLPPSDCTRCRCARPPSGRSRACYDVAISMRCAR
jgi:sortase A